MRRIRELERAGEFDRHVDPIPTERILPVDQHYRYVSQRTFAEKCRYAGEKALIVRPFTFFQNVFVYKTEVIGREHLKGLKGAVITCNHVQKFDCLAVKYALKGHRTFVVAASFNNMKGFLGDMMRAGDMLPLNTTIRGTGNFSREVDHILTDRKDFLLIYPEASMWYNYRKPRPYKDGGFGFAARNHVPVVPLFITYRNESGTADAEPDETGCEKLYFTVHIGKPVYPDEGLTKKENTERMKQAAFDYSRQVFETTYGQELHYTCDTCPACPDGERKETVHA